MRSPAFAPPRRPSCPGSLAYAPLPAALLALALAPAGCAGGDDAPGCEIAVTAPLLRGSLAALPEARLHRAGERFVLAGLDGDTFRWATLDEQGALGAESSFTVPPRAAGPWFGFAGKDVPATEALVVFAVPRTPTQLGLVVVAQAAGQAAPPPRDLVDLPDRITARELRAAMGTSRSGKRAAFAWGYEGQRLQPSVLVLGEGGAPAGKDLVLTQAPSRWDCLAVSPSRTDLGVSVMGRGATADAAPTFAIVELNDAGTVAYSIQLELTTKGGGCGTAIPSRRGYALTWQTDDGTFITDYDIARNVATPPVLAASASRLGGAARQPPVAGLGSIASDFAISFNREGSAHEIRRYDVFGGARGGTLTLPSQGDVGPASAWAAGDSLWLTYLDRAAAGTTPGTRRLLVKARCPATP